MNPASDEPTGSGSASELLPNASPSAGERPPNDLQRAIQQRAQESLERSSERARTKPAPLKWALTFVLALIPVVILVIGIDAFVRVFHKINDVYSKLPVPAPEPQTPVNEPIVQQPGVIILESMPPEDAQPSDEAGQPATTPSPKQP